MNKRKNWLVIAFIALASFGIKTNCDLAQAVEASDHYGGDNERASKAFHAVAFKDGLNYVAYFSSFGRGVLEGGWKTGALMSLLVTGYSYYRWAYLFTNILSAPIMPAIFQYFFGDNPLLLKESTKKSFWGKLKGFVGCRGKKLDSPKMVFPQAQEKEIGCISSAIAIATTKIESGNPAITRRNLLIVGPPGVGKSSLAEKLAKDSGMDFAIVSAAALAQFPNGKAITEIDKLWNWANNNKRGTIIFLDEVETLFASRDGIADKTGDAYKIMTHLLSLTGARSSKIMLIMATNKRDDLDEAIESRIDDVLCMDLPDCDTRVKLLQLYVDKCFFNRVVNSAAFVQSAQSVLTDRVMYDIAQKTEGYEHRKIASLVNILYSNTLASVDEKLTQGLIDDALLQVQARQEYQKRKEQKKALQGVMA